MVADVFHFYAGAVDKHYGETIPVAGGIDMTFREPLGVVGLIVPWNFPLNISSLEARPRARLRQHRRAEARRADAALARSGSPSSRSRPASPRACSTCSSARARVVGQRLVEHPDVAKIGFTGSTEVGRGVMKGAAGTIKRVTLELGGKSANVVFADADLEKAAAAAPYAVFDNAGQDCCARSRILVERSAYDRFAELLSKRHASVKVGDPTDEATEMGPLISAAAPRDRRRASSKARRSSPATAPDGKGFWYPCTLVEATNDDRIAREEVFGPVAALIPFDDEADAIRIANDTPYGLSGSIWTRERRPRAARRARARDRRAERQLEQLGPRVDAVRRLQAVRLRPRARDARRSTATRKSRTSTTRRRADSDGSSRRQGLRDHGRRRRHGPRGGAPLQRGRRAGLRRRRQPRSRRGNASRTRRGTRSRSRSTSPTSERQGDDGRDRRALRRHRRPLQQRRHLAERRRLRARHRRRGVGPRAGREHEGRLPLLQARHPAPASSAAAAA